MKEKFKQLFFTLYNIEEKAQIVTFFNYITIDNILSESQYNNKPEIFGRLYNGDYRIIPDILKELKIEFEEEIIKNGVAIKRKYSISRKLEELELHLLREKFLNNRVMLLPPDARIHDRLVEFGAVENMNLVSKFLRIISPVYTIDMDFHTFSGISEGESYLNEEHKKNYSKIPVLPSIFEMKKTDYKKIEKDSYKKEILGLAKYIPEIPIILVVVSDNCELTFFQTNRETGEILFNNTIRLIENGIFTKEIGQYRGSMKSSFLKAKIYTYKGEEKYYFDKNGYLRIKASIQQTDLFTDIYKELTEGGERAILDIRL